MWRARQHPRPRGNWQVRVSLGRDPETGRYPYTTRWVHGTKRNAQCAAANLVTEFEVGGRRRLTRRVEHRRVRFAVQHGIGDPAWCPEMLDPGHFTEWCQTAEVCNWDAIAFTDHPAPTAPWIDSGGEGVADLFTALAFAAAVTNSVRLLTLVMVPTYRNPFQAAQQVATLDRLSAGRVTLGLGTGYLFGEMRALGSDPARRLDDFDRNVDILIQAFSGAEVTEANARFTAKRVRLLPPVVQQPHPPLWIHGNSRFGIERAARYGAGWLGMMTGNSEVLARTTRTRPLPDFVTLAERISDVESAAEASGRLRRPEIIVAGAWPMLDIRAGRSPAQYAEEIAILTELGVDWTVSSCCGDDPGASQATIEWFGSEVIALL